MVRVKYSQTQSVRDVAFPAQQMLLIIAREIEKK